MRLAKRSCTLGNLMRTRAAIFGLCFAVLACKEEVPVPEDPSDQIGCAGSNEAQCHAPCSTIKSRRPRSDDLEFMECIAHELGGSTAITCALAPDQSECRIFPTTLLAVGWRETPCNHPLCSESDAGTDSGANMDSGANVILDASLVLDATNHD